MIEFIKILLMLLFLHALADFTFQTESMARGKSRKNADKQYQYWIKELGRDPKKFKKTWFYWLSAHALIQGGLILFIFGIW